MSKHDELIAIYEERKRGKNHVRKPGYWVGKIKVASRPIRKLRKLPA